MTTSIRIASAAQVGVLAIVGALVLASACSPSPEGSSDLTGTPTSQPPAAVSPAAPSPAPSILGSDETSLQAGTYMLDLNGKPTVSSARIPEVVLTLPDGWSSIRGFGVNHGGEGNDWMGITFWQVDEVYAHPCRWKGPRLTPGPSVDDLATVLAKVPLRDATAPTKVSLDGHEGLYMEWSVPADMDFATCDADDGTHYFESWTARDGDRYQQGPGQVDRLWILDVDGQRLVIDAMSMPGADSDDIATMLQIVESIEFQHRRTAD
jgi:hypothetical protein